MSDRAVGDVIAAALARGKAPRLAPDQRIAGLVTRQGIFEQRDPRVAGRLWGRWEWLGLLLWALMVVGALVRAWRAHGGPRAMADQRP